MKQVFADTSFYIAAASPGDDSHAKATAWMKDFQGAVVTTDFVVVELANFFSRAGHRSTFEVIHAYLQTDDRVTVVPASRELLNRGIGLYRGRPDKNWSLTDCISFLVMEDRGIRDAATADQHFAQAGFLPLLI